MSVKVLRKKSVLLAFVLGAFAVLAPGTAAAAEPPSSVGPWNTVGSDRARPLDESQGLASIVRDGATTFQYTGIGTIPADLQGRGWNHVGDPDSYQGTYIEPYQRDDRGGKLFRVQGPDGKWSEYQHTLESWEANNNSFTAISPDGRWMVSGEWGSMDKLLVFPTPGIAFTDPGANLPYAFAIRLDHPVQDVQGCDFSSDTQLLCASDDGDGVVGGTKKPLLQLDLAHALDGADVSAKVSALGQLPLESGCSGNFEVEGIDHEDATGTLRVIVMSPAPCILTDSKTWRFTRG